MKQKLEWVKKHKKELLIGAGTVVSTVALIAIGVKCSKLRLNGTGKIVDEDIFTSLAPAIEEAVLDKSLEKIILERTYDMGDNIAKFVTINIENVYGN